MPLPSASLTCPAWAGPAVPAITFMIAWWSSGNAFMSMPSVWSGTSRMPPAPGVVVTRSNPASSAGSSASPARSASMNWLMGLPP
ncbi:hypothetical protein [Streptomyces sp. NPDC014685]|uniref:hypothetical protein n=1 Tax=Streptomyces sp. NPDC014685 TaxID=3364881 RepID=UPI003701BB61